MNVRAAIEQLIHLKRPGTAMRLLLLPLALCSRVYSAAMRLRAWLYKACIFESHGLPCRVIAVGNMTVGGTGKTPTVCLLARSLAGKGFKVCVVNRGYRGAKTQTPLIVSDGTQVLAPAADAGDEAVMLGRKLPGIPVIACADRVAAGALACGRFGAQAVILDDGFQHLRLRRDLDIVLINAADPFGNGHLLPRGILREPLPALGRAGMIVFTKAAAPDAVAAHLPLIGQLNASAPVFTASYAIAGFRDGSTGSPIAAEEISGAPIAALASIGDPESFLHMLARGGLAVAEKLLYPDHHGYGAPEYGAIRQAAGRVRFVVTTEKDIAKLDRDMLQINNLIVMEIEQVIEPAEKFFTEVLRRSGLR
jgi:tetraacyldisaccharide 4'-kinase